MPIKSLTNCLVDYNSNSLEEHLNQASLQAIVSAINTTVLSSTTGTKIPGLADWTVNVGGLWSPTLHGYLNPDVVTPPSTMRTLVVTLGESGSTVVYTWTSNSFISDYQVTIDPTNAIVWSGVLSVSGAPSMS